MSDTSIQIISAPKSPNKVVQSKGQAQTTTSSYHDDRYSEKEGARAPIKSKPNAVFQSSPFGTVESSKLDSIFEQAEQLKKAMDNFIEKNTNVQIELDSNVPSALPEVKPIIDTKQNHRVIDSEIYESDTE